MTDLWLSIYIHCWLCGIWPQLSCISLKYKLQINVLCFVFRCAGGWEIQRWMLRKSRLKVSCLRVQNVKKGKICGTRTSQLLMAAVTTVLEDAICHTPPALCVSPAPHAHRASRTKTRHARSGNSVTLVFFETKNFKCAISIQSNFYVFLQIQFWKNVFKVYFC